MSAPSDPNDVPLHVQIIAVGRRRFEERPVYRHRISVAERFHQAGMGLALAGVVGVLAYSVGNHQGPLLQGQAEVLKKEFTPYHLTSYLTLDGEGHATTAYRMEQDRWDVTVRATQGDNKGQVEQISVNQAVYDRMDVGDTVDMQYKAAQFSHQFWIVGTHGRIQPTPMPAAEAPPTAVMTPHRPKP